MISALHELLDDPRADPAAVRAELRDIRQLNALFGGTRAVVQALQPYFRTACNGRHGTGNLPWTLLDVGAGSGDIALAAVTAGRRYGVELRPVGVELNPTAAHLARDNGMRTVLGDGSALPFGARSVDVVIASQVLHHLPREHAVRWIATFDRLARRVVVLADLRRSRLAMIGVWAATLGLGMGRVTRHDAVVSLRRGYRRRELDAMLREAGVRTVARYQPGFRIVAAWAPRLTADG
jgi:2-polyprenyl-3-methyl-5-hydroxy-6-metoxy-1,4-benzoquinol methylase